MEWFWVAIKYWPFLAAMSIFSMIGQFTSKKVFTRENAYMDFGKDRFGRFLHWVMYWGRESLVLHPIAAGFAVGRLWEDPAPGIATRQESMWFFAFAGFCSLFVWVVLKGKAKEHGIMLELPGESVPPTSGVEDDPHQAPAPHREGEDSDSTPP